MAEQAVAAEHEHWFHALWVHLGPFGRQDIHYHPCTADEDDPGSCPVVLVGYGIECNGSAQRHVRSSLPLPDDLAVPGEPEAGRVPANPASGIPDAEAAWQAWYEPEHDIGRFMATSRHDEMHRAFLAGAAAEREWIRMQLAAFASELETEHEPSSEVCKHAEGIRLAIGTLEVPGD